MINKRQIFVFLRNIKEKGFFHLLTANFFIGFIGFGSQLLVAKFLTPIELGQIKVIQSYVGVGTIIAGFGFNTAVLKLCSEKRTKEEKKHIFSQNLIYTIFPIFFVIIALIILSNFELLSPDGLINKLLPIFIIVIPARVFSSLIMAYLQALKKIHLMAKIQVGIRLFGFLLLIPATYFFGLTGFIISTIIIGYFALLPLIKMVSKDLVFKGKRKKQIFNESIFIAKWSVAGNGISTIGQFIDVFVLNYLIEDRISFGYYGLATIFITGLNYITSTVQSIATPYFSEKSNNKSEFVRVLKKYEKLMVLLTFIVSVCAFILIPFAIKILYGEEYERAGFYFRLLVFKYFFWSCYSLFGVAILGLGKMRYNFLSVAISVPISITLNFLFISSYQATGAAIAQVVSYFISLIIVTLMAKYVIAKHFNNNLDDKNENL